MSDPRDPRRLIVAMHVDHDSQGSLTALGEKQLETLVWAIKAQMDKAASLHIIAANTAQCSNTASSLVSACGGTMTLSKAACNGLSREADMAALGSEVSIAKKLGALVVVIGMEACCNDFPGYYGRAVLNARFGRQRVAHGQALLIDDDPPGIDRIA